MRALMVLSGAWPQRDVAAVRPFLMARAQACDVIAAVDGGLDHLLALSIEPDLYVGDGDSLSAAGRQWLSDHAVPRLVRPPEKDETDAELAMQALRDRGCTDLEVWSPMGPVRPDHVMGNWLFLAQVNARWSAAMGGGAHVVQTDGQTVIHYLSGRTRLDLADLPRAQGQAACYVSLMALGAPLTGVTLTGLKYPLDNGVIDWGTTLGISNEPAADKAAISIQLQSGCGAVVITPKD